jgi:hypothetical protein
LSERKTHKEQRLAESTPAEFVRASSELRRRTGDLLIWRSFSGVSRSPTTLGCV